MDYFSLFTNHPQMFNNKGMAFRIEKSKEIINSWEEEEVNKLQKQGKPIDWAKIGVVYEDPYIFLLRDLIEFPNGKMGSYFRLFNRSELSGGRGTVILPVFNEMIVIQRQFRHPIRSWSWEFPRGFGEEYLGAKENAIKEVFEEIEGEVSELIDLGLYHSNTGLEGNQVALFYAKLSSLGKPNIAEGIREIKLINVLELEKMISSAIITDGFTIAAYTRAKLMNLI